jgi:hypothetical protein
MSLLEHMTDQRPLGRRELLWQLDLYRKLQRRYGKPKPYATEVMRSGPWKLLSRDGEPVELFNIETDPLEETNRLEAEPARAASMAARVRQWLAEPRHSWKDENSRE